MNYEDILEQIDEARSLYEARVENGADPIKALSYLQSDIQMIADGSFTANYE